MIDKKYLKEQTAKYLSFMLQRKLEVIQDHQKELEQIIEELNYRFGEANK